MPVKAHGVRQKILFDDSWRFHRGDIDGAEKPDYIDSSWRILDIPHDWSIEDMPLFACPEPPFCDAVSGQWRFHKGDDFAWKEPGIDDHDWETVQLPATWEDHSGYTQDNVFGWFRRKITVDEQWRGKRFVLGLGKIDDVDEAFFNGAKIGQTGAFPPDFKGASDTFRLYAVPPELIRYGQENLVAVRVFDGLGQGGIWQPNSSRLRSGPFDSSAIGNRSTGFTIGGTAWYRKTFSLTKDLQGKIVHLQFDGVYMNADIWLNGAHLGNHPYGYTSFWYDITPYLKFDRRNVLAVQVKNEGANSRWYSGSGLYRHVWLIAMKPVHVAHWGTYITTPEISSKSAQVRIITTLANESAAGASISLTTDIVDREGATVVMHTAEKEVPKGISSEIEQNITVLKPRLWSINTPNLYTAKSTVRVNGKISDTTETPFGIRSIAFDAEHGFRLNGVSIKLKGACMHHDNGCLGACAFDRAEERRVEIMKANGFNAIRTSHNPPSPAFLDACDRLGIAVIDEAFDAWNTPKMPNDYARHFKQWWVSDLDSMLLRDRNHPCIIIWSTGNEIPERAQPLGVDTSRMLAGHVRRVDPTRPVTAALCNGNNWKSFDDNFATLDIAGYNYQDGQYETDHARVPSRIIVATESFPSRAYDFWEAVMKHDYVIGDFVWTGYDYLGEAGIGWGANSFPWTTAFCGDIDVCGWKRPASYYRDILWQCGAPLSIFVRNPLLSFDGKPSCGLWEWEDVYASWNWPGHEGREIEVRIYAACERVRLFLNKRDMGTRPVDKAIASFTIPYEPGLLSATGFNGDKKAAKAELRTAGAPSKIRLAADRARIHADGQDLCFITAEVLDDNNILNPVADNLIRFSLEGPTAVIGLGNGNPISVESFQLPRRKAWHGKCLAVIRARRKRGAITVTASSEGLTPAHVKLQAR